jgi:hypothetical protein
MSLYKKILSKMRERGLDPTERHTFDFYVCLPSKRAANAVAERARRFNFAVEVMPGVKPRTWFCIATKTSPTPEGLRAWWRDRLAVIACVGEFFDFVARERGGCLRGWEIDVHQP